MLAAELSHYSLAGAAAAREIYQSWSAGIVSGSIAAVPASADSGSPIAAVIFGGNAAAGVPAQRMEVGRAASSMGSCEAGSGLSWCPVFVPAIGTKIGLVSCS
jgi:hypothetical protein